ncbi:MAG: ketopantoate reductase family protein [Myxococcota bacterium]
MDILVVGAGAVGQVYGHHLGRGGASVTFLVKPKHEEAVRGGLCLYEYRLLRATDRIEVTGYDVISSVEDVAAGRWDQVWLCISSTALRAPWTGEILEAIPGAATLVSLQPGLEDQRWLLERWPGDRLVHGVIALLAWQAPLAGQDLPRPGIGYWLPPWTPLPFAGPEERVAPVVDTLEAGGCKAKRDPGAPRKAACISALMMPVVAALELEGWSLDRLLAGCELAGGLDAANQAVGIVEAETGASAPVWAKHAGPRGVRAVLRVGRQVAPIPLETYLAWHFRKVGDQTRMLLRGYVDRGRAHDLPVDALERLSQRLSATDAGATSSGR